LILALTCEIHLSGGCDNKDRQTSKTEDVSKD